MRRLDSRLRGNDKIFQLRILRSVIPAKAGIQKPFCYFSFVDNHIF